MVASDTKSLLVYLKEASKNLAIKTQVARAVEIAKKADIDADQIAKVVLHVEKDHEKGLNKELSTKKKHYLTRKRNSASY